LIGINTKRNGYKRKVTCQGCVIYFAEKTEQTGDADLGLSETVPKRIEDYEDNFAPAAAVGDATDSERKIQIPIQESQGTYQTDESFEDNSARGIAVNEEPDETEVLYPGSENSHSTLGYGQPDSDIDPALNSQYAQEDNDDLGASNSSIIDKPATLMYNPHTKEITMKGNISGTLDESAQNLFRRVLSRQSSTAPRSESRGTLGGANFIQNTYNHNVFSNCTIKKIIGESNNTTGAETFEEISALSSST